MKFGWIVLLVALGLTNGYPFVRNNRVPTPRLRSQLQPTGMFLNSLMGRIHGVLDGSEEDGSSFKSMDLTFMKEMAERRLRELLKQAANAAETLEAVEKRAGQILPLVPVIGVTPKPTKFYKPARAGFSPWG